MSTAASGTVYDGFGVNEKLRISLQARLSGVGNGFDGSMSFHVKGDASQCIVGHFKFRATT